MIISKYKLTENKNIAKDIYKMSFEISDEISKSIKAGQFVNLTVEGKFLKRPISINDLEKNKLSIIYKVVGVGTKVLSEKKIGEEVEVMLPLGNGYDLKVKENIEQLQSNQVTLVGGGIGVPPLYLTAKRLKEAGIEVTAVLGFRNTNDVILEKEFEQLGVKTEITTEDGSYGRKGYVTEYLEGNEYVMTCGPELMLKAVYDKCQNGQFSFEERMGCGFGACMGCSCQTLYGNKRICKEGPILVKDEIIWS